MKMVGLGKVKRESMADRSSLATEEQEVPQKVEEVKPREPLSGKDDPRNPARLLDDAAKGDVSVVRNRLSGAVIISPVT